MSQNNSFTSYEKQTLLKPRGLLRQFWDLIGIPFRLALFPDDWNRRFGWTCLEEERLRAVLPHLEGKLLDVGAGRNLLVRTHGEGVGVDIHDFGGGATIVEETRSLPWADSTFDTVCFVACLNHIPYRSDALAEARRVLKPGGRLVATMINRFLGGIGHAIWWYGEDRHRGGMAEGETGGLNPEEMRRLLKGAGFEGIEEKSFCHGLNGLYLARKPEAVPQRKVG